MPRSTIQHPFEYAIFAWAGEAHGIQTWFVPFDDSGRAGSVVFAPQPDELDRLKSAHSRWFLYDPFDFPEYGWVQWQNVDRGSLERLFGKTWPPDQAPQVPPTWSFMY